MVATSYQGAPGRMKSLMKGRIMADLNNSVEAQVSGNQVMHDVSALFGIKLIETYLAAPDVCILIGRPDNHLIADGKVMGFMPGTDKGVIGILNFKTGDMQWLKGHIIEEIRGTAPTLDKLKKLIEADTKVTTAASPSPDITTKAEKNANNPS